MRDLKHTFGRQLRAAGVSFEDRQDLLGHRSGRITTHCSAPELQNLLVDADRVSRNECPQDAGNGDREKESACRQRSTRLN